MPYKLYKSGKKYCVRNSETGEGKGCSSSRSKAVGHMRALYAAESGESMGRKDRKIYLDGLIQKALDGFYAEYPEEIPEEAKEIEDILQQIETKDMGEMVTPYVGWATTYAELDAQEDAEEISRELRDDIDKFPFLARNILDNPEVTDKASALQTLSSELVSRLGNTLSTTGEEDDSEDKELKTKITDISHEKPEIVKSKIGFLENLLLSVKTSIVNFFSQQDTTKEPSNGGDAQQNIMFWKDNVSGDWRWIARYSNNFRDRDNPPEIISERSHRAFIEKVEKGLAPYPELWLWHYKNMLVGKADWLGYDNAGFALAAGHFYPGCEQVAEFLAKEGDVAVSHGMPPNTIVRDPNDPTVIIEHETREISPLPRGAAANELTGFYTLEEQPMIDEKQRKALIVSWGLDPSIVSKIESLNQVEAQKAQDLGIESKELPVDETKDANSQPPVDALTETPPIDEPKETPITRQEIADGIAAILLPELEKLVSLQSQVDALSKEIKALVDGEGERNERIEKALSQTPVASISSLLASRVIGNPSAIVKKGDPLYDKSPQVTEPIKDGRIGIRFLDEMLDGKK